MDKRENNAISISAAPKKWHVLILSIFTIIEFFVELFNFYEFVYSSQPKEGELFV